MLPPLVPIIDGNEAGETIVFIQGWPDDASLWDSAVAAVQGSYRCVRLTLPNFAGDRTARWGYSTEEIVEALVDFIRQAGRGRRVTLVLHDWGSYWGHAAHHRAPELVARVATVDVAPHFKPPASSLPGILAYQWWLLGAFAVGGPIGDAMTRGFARFARVPVDIGRVDAWMNYPYRNFWADAFSKRGAKLIAGYWPKCPLLFVYGEKKPFHFHSAAWVDHVRSVGGEVVGVPCGHWVPRDPAFAGILARWLSESAKAVS